MLKLEELGHLTDDLAVQLVMRQPDSPIRALAEVWVPRLKGMVESARAEGAIAAAESAGSLIALLTAAQAPEGAGLSEQLQAGLTELQRGLQQPGAPKTAANPPSIAQDPELMADFILESGEHLANIETQLLMLERDPCDAEALNSVFRGFHTIKGLAGFLELWNVQKVAHETETVLDRARNGERPLTPPAIDAILASADYLRRWLRYLEAPGPNGPPVAGEEALLGRIRGLCSPLRESGRAVRSRAQTGNRRRLRPNARKRPSPLPAASRPKGAAAAPVRSKWIPPSSTCWWTWREKWSSPNRWCATTRNWPHLRSARFQRNMAQLTRITAGTAENRHGHAAGAGRRRCSGAWRGWCAICRGNSESGSRWSPPATKSSWTAPSSRNWPTR